MTQVRGRFPGELEFNGIRVITSEWLTEAGEPVTVRRSWRERLLTWPWRPFQTTRTYVPQIPYRGAYKLPSGVMLMHPDTFRSLGCREDRAAH